MNEIDIIKNSLKETTVHCKISPVLWERFSEEINIIVNRQWYEAKFLNDDFDVHPDLQTIPNNCGGVYSFVVKPDLIPDTHLYLLYIGRAKYTSGQNLRKRCKEYISENRPKIETMVKNWGKYLYIRYLPLNEDNDLIDKVEAELINSILPPCNERIPSKIVRCAVSAFI